MPCYAAVFAVLPLLKAQGAGVRRDLQYRLVFRALEVPVHELREFIVFPLAVPDGHVLHQGFTLAVTAGTYSLAVEVVRHQLIVAAAALRNMEHGAVTRRAVGAQLIVFVVVDVLPLRGKLQIVCDLRFDIEGRALHKERSILCDRLVGNPALEGKAVSCGRGKSVSP